ncbi:hypothetical protein TRSC58_02044 [Trypanosoma rangeli SC58]|uniref:Phosphatidylinositol-specific phospholipase C X domain-containing protein n=1 Tax=Trypanosoma rangeli SC58 TaxID=429131 RepID=A0A061J7Z7_TRYRA|nr:hypothetical protein TRSC58_02044 [Trypanosoma rangeli SC58]
MGCAQSKVAQARAPRPSPVTPKKRLQSPRRNAGNGGFAMSPRNCEQQANAERYLRLILEGADNVLGGGFRFNSAAEGQQVALTFLNSCVEVTRTRFRLTTGVIVDTIEGIATEEKLKTILSTLPYFKENCVDEGFSRLLYDWLETNSGSSATAEVDAAVRPAGKAKHENKNNHTATGFSNILVTHLLSATAIPAIDIFSKFAQGRESMTEKEYGNFLRETQHSELTDSQVKEKYNFRFGGAIHRYNFNTYFGSFITNSALDPMRTADVWQDMTQPLTRYSVNIARIESETDLNRALVDSSRAFLLNLKKDEKGVLCSGSCPIRTILESIQTRGFATNSYPIVLCLPPANPISVELGNELAFTMKDFSSLFAKGLMFEGSILSDPKFSPAALRKKVLLMGYQSRLTPFVGCYVADLNRESLGVRVTEVVQGTPAAKAGLAKDDWLTHFNGEAIPNKQTLRERLAKLRLGEEFFLRKENLEDIKIVVGGRVDVGDTNVSAELSEILFLKYTEGKGDKPWETQVLSEESIKDPKLMREDLDDHFALFSSEGTTVNADSIKTATKLGVQFIDTGSVQEAQIWAHGRFVDNGGSGYLIKSDAAAKTTVGVTVEVIAGLQDMKGACVKNGKVRVYGAGSARIDGNRFNFKDCNDASVAVLDCEFAHDGGFFSFVAAFPLGLLRSGYRVLPMQQVGGPRKLGISKLGAYCFIRRNE